MCDYALKSVPNRPAKEGEDLITHRFPGGTIGLVSQSDLDEKTGPLPGKRQSLWPLRKEARTHGPVSYIPAVCIPPGALLLLRDIPEHLRHELGVGPGAPVRLTRITAAANCHREAVRFGNGREVLLQRLSEGQRVRVLMFGSDNPAGAPESLEEKVHVRR